MAEQPLRVQGPSASAFSTAIRSKDNAPKVSKSSSGTRKGIRNAGKLAQLMDMPMDIFLEVMGFLRPPDLLNISRVSRHFRKILLHRSSKGMWAAARKNAKDPPAPPDVLSEPKYACMLFEHTCMACGATRAGKISHRMSLRLCTPCWSQNLKAKQTILRTRKSAKPVAEIIFSLLPSQTATGPFYVAELEAVFARYQSLSGTKRDEFVQERQALVTTMKWHASAVAMWQNRTRKEQNQEELQTTRNREKSIIAKLVEMGYSPDQFPEAQDTTWHPLTSQPRELTPQIWKRILPKLEACIQEEAKRREVHARGRRMRERQDGLRDMYGKYCAELPLTYTDPLPTFYQILHSDEVKHILRLDNELAPILPEDFAAIAPGILKKHAQEMSASLMKSLQLAFDTNTPVSEDDGAARTTLHLQSVFAVFSCAHCYYGFRDPGAYSWSQLTQHIRERHVTTAHPFASVCDISTSRLELIRGILASLDISEDARYDDVSRKVVCLCGKPSFEQPAEFSALVHHIEEESPSRHPMKYKLFDNAFQVAKRGSGEPSDHDPENYATTLRLLREDETFTSVEVAVPEDLMFPMGGVRCRRCTGHFLMRFIDPREFAWHVRTKHHAEPSMSDMRFF